MKIFLDENFPKKATSFLEEKGYEVLDVRGSENEGLDDVALFKLVNYNKALFLTTDKDFFHTIHFKSKPHYGIVVIALAQPNTRKILEKLQWFLTEIPQENLSDKCFLISDNRCKVYM